MKDRETANTSLTQAQERCCRGNRANVSKEKTTSFHFQRGMSSLLKVEKGEAPSRRHGANGTTTKCHTFDKGRQSVLYFFV